MVRPAAGFLAVVVLLLSCSSGDEPAVSASISVDGDEVSVDGLLDAVAGLCEAANQVASDRDAARTTFFNRSHQALHTIAKAVEATDRRAAAVLLTAKQAVETGLDVELPLAGLSSDLQALIDASRAALAELDVIAPPCEEAP